MTPATKLSAINFLDKSKAKFVEVPSILNKGEWLDASLEFLERKGLSAWIYLVKHFCASEKVTSLCGYLLVTGHCKKTFKQITI
jgi:hypothetical protein